MHCHPTICIVSIDTNSDFSALLEHAGKAKIGLCSRMEVTVRNIHNCRSSGISLSIVDTKRMQLFKSSHAERKIDWELSNNFQTFYQRCKVAVSFL
jgi:hypothetical protein